MRFGMIQLSGLCENCSLGCSLSPALSDCFLGRLAGSKRNATDERDGPIRDALVLIQDKNVLLSEHIDVSLLLREHDGLCVVLTL